MKILSKLEFEQFHTYLFDAAGVVYTDKGIVSNAQAVIKECQKRGNVFLVTNNSYMYPIFISERLEKSNITISTDHIISSGAVKYDKDITSLITNKVVYLLGEDTSKPYFIEAGCKKITKDLNEADIIMLAAFLQTYSDKLLDDIIDHLKLNPKKPIVCCNPDRYVVGKTGLHPVVGLYAETIEKAIGRPIIWFGKPFKNFSMVVNNILQNNKIPLDKGVCFFDDNVENVINMEKHIGISGCWIKKSGIGNFLETDAIIKKQGKPSFVVDSLTSFS